jgi:hypothetical protein
MRGAFNVPIQIMASFTLYVLVLVAAITTMATALAFSFQSAVPLALTVGKVILNYIPVYGCIIYTCKDRRRAYLVCSWLSTTHAPLVRICPRGLNYRAGRSANES